MSNKERILKIQEIFFKETDEENNLSFEDLLNRLKAEYGDDYEVGMKAIKDDVSTLKKRRPYLIEDTDKFGKKLYSQQNRTFETYQLRILMDAISSARFITSSERNRILDKIKTLTSNKIAEKLTNKVFIDGKVVTEDEQIKFYIDKLHTAIQESKIIVFEYGKYNLQKEFVINAKKYEVAPYGLVWSNGFYYLVAYNENKDAFINYRVDRMRKVNLLEDKYAKIHTFELDKYLDSCFNMYPGNVMGIKIKFDNQLINAIVDRFGTDVKIDIADEDSFHLYTRAAINEGLVRWVLNWGSDAQVLKPDILRDMIKEEIDKMYSIYD